MYGFKIFVSTLIFLYMIMVLWVALTNNTKGKPILYAMFALEALSLMAIWG